MILLKTSNGHSQYAVDNTEISNEKELVEGGGVMAMDTKPEEMDVLDVGECPPSRLQTDTVNDKELDHVEQNDCRLMRRMLSRHMA